MSKDSFEYLCAELSPHIAKRNTNFRKAIAVRHRVAIACIGLPTPRAIELLETCLALENPPCVPS